MAGCDIPHTTCHHIPHTTYHVPHTTPTYSSQYSLIIPGRGIDFLGINTVVNYDMPATTTDYVHRIGRTGRGGRQGTAITLFVEQDAPRLRGIANLIRAAGSEVCVF